MTRPREPNESSEGHRPSNACDPDDGMTPPPSFYETMAKDCCCCRGCVNVPCEGVCAGGVCDRSCHCSEDYDDDRAGTDDSGCDE